MATFQTFDPKADETIKRIIAVQAKITALQQVIAYDRAALGIRGRLEKQITRLRHQIIDLAYDGLPEGGGD